jgi:hypothetical protein
MALEILRIDPYNGDYTSGLTYYGYAAAGTQDSDSNWSIKKKEVINGVVKYYYPFNSNGLLLSGLVWSYRTGYTYSNNGSILFKGNSGSTLSISNDIDLRFRTGDFTIEWWQYQTDSIQFPRIFSMGSYPNATMSVSYESGSFLFWYGSTHTSIGSLGTYKNSWVHFAISRSGTTFKVFKNGIQLGSNFTLTYDFNDSTNGLKIGNESSPSNLASFGGYITNFRWVKGTAVYTSNFTVPTSPLTSIENTKILLLTLTNSTAWDDSSGLNKTIVNNNTTWSSFTPF